MPQLHNDRPTLRCPLRSIWLHFTPESQLYPYTSYWMPAAATTTTVTLYHLDYLLSRRLEI